jgi:hypothetical protein
MALNFYAHWKNARFLLVEEIESIACCCLHLAEVQCLQCQMALFENTLRF